MYIAQTIESSPINRIGLTAENSVNSRSTYTISNVFNCLDKVDQSFNEAKSLVYTGALDRFGHTRPELLQFVYNPTPAANHPVLNGCEPQPDNVSTIADYPLHKKLIQ